VNEKHGDAGHWNFVIGAAKAEGVSDALEDLERLMNEVTRGFRREE
jgi:hypothetical protein